MKRSVAAFDAMVRRWLERFTVAVLGDDGLPMAARCISSGDHALDAALGGGLPLGRIVEVYGGAGSGKTDLALTMVRAAQRRGHLACFVDVDGAFSPSRASVLGVDLSRLVVIRPQNGEQAFSLVDRLAREGGLGLAVIDNIAALVPMDELKAPVGALSAGTHARMLSRALRRVHGALIGAGCTLVCINQLRTAFDDAGRAIKVPTGGVALSCYAAARVELTAPGEAVVRKGSAGVGRLAHLASPVPCGGPSKFDEEILITH
jgi:recombination protein RecA